MDSVITHFFWLPLQHEQLADGRKARFSVRSSRSKNLRIAFDTSGSKVDGSMARKGRVAGRGGATTGGTAAMAGASAAPRDPPCKHRCSTLISRDGGGLPTVAFQLNAAADYVGRSGGAGAKAGAAYS